MSGNKAKQNKKQAHVQSEEQEIESGLDNSVLKQVVTLARNFRQTLKQFASLENELRDEVTFNLRPRKGDSAQQLQVTSKLQDHAQDFVKLFDTLHQVVPTMEALQNDISKFSTRSLNASHKLQAQIDKMKEDDAKRQKAAQNEFKLSDLKSEIRIHEVANKELHGKLAVKDQEANKHISQILQQQKQIEEMKLKLRDIQQLDPLRTQISELQQKCQKLEVGFAQETINRTQAQKELQTKQHQLDQQTFLNNQMNIKLNAQMREMERIALSLNEHSGTIQKQTGQLKEEKEAHAKTQKEMSLLKQEMDKSKLALEQELKKEVAKKEELLQKMQKSHAHQVQQLQQQNQYEKGQYQLLHNENLRLNDQYQQAQLHIQELKEELQTKEKEHEERLAKQAQPMGDILFEEDLSALDSKQQISPNDVTKLFQVIDFFDKSKPDGLETRNMFFSDQIAAKENGQHVIMLCHQDFETFDYFSQVVRGVSKEHAKTREDAIDNAVSFIQNFLQRSQEICNYNVTFKQIGEQISELATSNVFLNGYAEFPYIENDPRLQSVLSVRKNQDAVEENRSQQQHAQTGSEANNSLSRKESGTNWDTQKNKPIKLTIMDPATAAGLPSPLPMNQKEKQQLVDGFEESGSGRMEHQNRWGDMSDDEQPKQQPQTQEQQSNQSQQQNSNGTPARSSRLTSWTSVPQGDEQQPQQQVDKANPQRNHQKPYQQQQQQQRSLGKRGGRGTRAGNHRGGQQRNFRKVYHETDSSSINK